MNVENIVSLVRAQTGASTNTVSDSQMMDYVNLVYHDLETEIGLESPDYFYESFTTDLVANQSEYSLPMLNRITGVYAKYSNNKDFYVKFSQMDFDDLAEDISYYKTQQSTLNPFYIIGDQNIFICPMSDETVEGGFKIDGIAPLPDLSIDSVEAEIRINKNYHGVFIMGIKVFVYGALGMGSEKREAKSNYEQAKQEMLREFSQRNLDEALEAQQMPLEQFA